MKREEEIAIRQALRQLAVAPLDGPARAATKLTPREERVLRMRFGIGMDRNHTLEEVGRQFSVTRERIRQIQVKALRKLRRFYAL